MAIKPIYGMYVHDEVTDTDGIAKFSSEELEDIRVGADGVTYANAGDAVRGQMTNVHSKFNEYCTAENLIHRIDLTSKKTSNNEYIHTPDRGFYKIIFYTENTNKPNDSTSVAIQFSETDNTPTNTKDIARIFGAENNALFEAHFEVNENTPSFIRIFFSPSNTSGGAKLHAFVYKIKKPNNFLPYTTTENGSARHYPVNFIKGVTYCIDLFFNGCLASPSVEDTTATVTQISLGNNDQIIERNTGIISGNATTISLNFLKKNRYIFTAEDNFTVLNIYTAGAINVSPHGTIDVVLTPVGTDLANLFKKVHDIETGNTHNYPNEYIGEEINLSKKYFNFTNVAPISPGSGLNGMAIHNGYMFQCYDGGNCKVYDLSNYNELASFNLGSNIPSNHCGNACFGNEYFNDNAEFPALYVSGDLTNYACYVEDINLNGSVLKQIFDFTPLKNEYDFEGGACFVDNITNKLYFMQRTNPDINAQNNTMRIFEFYLPYLTDGIERADGVLVVTFNDSNVLRQFDLPVWQKYYQDGVIYNGKLYQISGVTGQSIPIIMNVYNISTPELLSSINLGPLSNFSEPEGIDVYNDSIFITFADTNFIAKLDF